MTRSKWRGHDIEIISGLWVYSDNKSLVSTDPNRKCGQCCAENRPDGHDSCLGELPGVKNACCGHGETENAYVQFADNSRIGGEEAIRWIQEQKGDSDEV